MTRGQQRYANEGDFGIRKGRIRIASLVEISGDAQKPYIPFFTPKKEE